MLKRMKKVKRDSLKYDHQRMRVMRIVKIMISIIPEDQKEAEKVSKT